MKVRFGDVTFDGGRRAVFRGPMTVPFSPKAFMLLELLLSRRPDAVSKAEILESVWPDTHVSEGSLTTLVKDLRKALGESPGETAWIRTVFGFGYAFDGAACEVPEVDPAGKRHVLVWGRQEIERVYAPLSPAPVYDQVPAFAGGDRGVLDLLAVERSGRLAVLELKATADLQLPMQALDYWLRVKWHLDRGEFTPNGYFPGIQLLPEPPRLFLVSPALEFHPATETVLSLFSPTIDVERVGVGVEWRKGLQVMFRLSGAERPCPEPRA